MKFKKSLTQADCGNIMLTSDTAGKCSHFPWLYFDYIIEERKNESFRTWLEFWISLKFLRR